MKKKITILLLITMFYVTGCTQTKPTSVISSSSPSSLSMSSSSVVNSSSEQISYKFDLEEYDRDYQTLFENPYKEYLFTGEIIYSQYVNGDYKIIMAFEGDSDKLLYFYNPKEVDYKELNKGDIITIDGRTTLDTYNYEGEEVPTLEIKDFTK